MNIGVGISAAKSGFELIKSLRELITRPDINPAEVLARLTEVQALLLDAKTALVDAQDEQARLNQRIAEVTRMADFGKDFKLEEGVYWRDAVPYCPVCWDVDRKTVRLGGPTVKPAGFYNSLAWECPLHRTTFGISSEKSQLK